MTIMKTKSPTAIRLSLNDEVKATLRKAKKIYPALSDPEILKVGLSKIVNEETDSKKNKEKREIRAMAAYSMGYDYLSDPEEDAYAEKLLRKHRSKNHS
jgi:hypothetical protein